MWSKRKKYVLLILNLELSRLQRLMRSICGQGTLDLFTLHIPSLRGPKNYSWERGEREENLAL